MESHFLPVFIEDEKLSKDNLCLLCRVYHAGNRKQSGTSAIFDVPESV